VEPDQIDLAGEDRQRPAGGTCLWPSGSANGRDGHDGQGTLRRHRQSGDGRPPDLDIAMGRPATRLDDREQIPGEHCHGQSIDR
jgi:hypothetical protein